MREKRNDICSAIVLIAFAIFMYAASYWIPPTTSDILGSRFFPRLVAGVIVLLSLIQLAGAVSALKKTDGEKEEGKKKEGFSRPLILTVVALFAYYFLVLKAGFVITSIVYLMFQSAVLMSKDDFKDKKKVIVLAVVAVAVPIFINTVFWRIFSIALPACKLF